jgi:hypothetical protein
MRYAVAEKLEIIRLVEQSSLSVRRTLAQLGIPRSQQLHRNPHHLPLSNPKEATKCPAPSCTATPRLSSKAPALTALIRTDC